MGGMGAREDSLDFVRNFSGVGAMGEGSGKAAKACLPQRVMKRTAAEGRCEQPKQSGLLADVAWVRAALGRSDLAVGRRLGKSGPTHPGRTRLGIGAATMSLALGVGCGAKSEASRAEPVAECVTYESALRACFHREIPFASQASLLPKSDADRERICSLCAENLTRIQSACR